MEFSYQMGHHHYNVCLNKYAKQADASVMINDNDTYVLISVVSKENDNASFFPLTINFIEKYFATGKIPGNYLRREGRSSEYAILASRLIDRPLRPLFPQHYYDEVQVNATLFSLDKDYEPDILSIIGASLALNLAPHIPFNTPVSGVCVGLIDDQFIINPSVSEKQQSLLDLKMAGSKDAILMVEAASQEVSEQIMLDALAFGHDYIKKLCDWQQFIINQVNIKKLPFVYQPKASEITLFNYLKENYQQAIKSVLLIDTKTKRIAAQNELLQTMYQAANSLELLDISDNIEALVNNIYQEIEKTLFRDLIIYDKYRVDKRDLTTIRPLSSEINLFPRTHGSALFTRGETQSLTTLTLAPLSEVQILDGIEIESEKHFLMHYNFPSYSVGEVGKIGSLSRREIGHGALAYKALKQVLPDKTTFPYTIRLSSEILESNGSSSQATICAGSLALMDGGVPIKAHVAGISMGLIKNDDDYTILTDIQGLEDHLGDMDFKVAGTYDGICALQMDIKINGVNFDILQQALMQAKKARYQILDHLNKTISAPRKTLQAYAPKYEVFMIDPQFIKIVIGKGGESINKIIQQTGVKIDLSDQGQVSIFHTDIAMIKQAREMIESICFIPQVNEVYQAKVIRQEKYGIFVKFKNQEGLLHVNDVLKNQEKKYQNIKIGDIIKVKIIKIDQKKRISVIFLDEE